MSWRDEANDLIREGGFKVGMRVRIAKDISITAEKHSKCGTMDDMAMSNETYKISEIAYDYIYINGYMWAPEDIYLDADIMPESLPATNIMFDPKEIVV